MALSLTGAQLAQIADTLLICKDPATTRLPVPTNSTDALSLAAKLDSIGADARFAHLGIGVADLTTPATPKVWMHNADVPWRIASTCKIALILAAVQLRDDVRWLYEQGFIKDEKDGDDLFANPALWQLSKNPVTAKLATTTRPPRISTIFMFSTNEPPDFLGPDLIETQFHDELVQNLANDTGKATNVAHMHWSFASTIGFTQRLWLAGARSDNIAASSCISEIGVAYIKAVQSAYGLFDPSRAMRMLLADAYSSIDTTAFLDPNNPDVTFRSIDPNDIETLRVSDPLYDKTTQQFSDRNSSESGNVLALMAYMLAWRQNAFISAEACNLITSCLSDGVPPNATVSFIAKGVLPAVSLRKQATKIGLLARLDGEIAYLNCEFAYLETVPADSTPVKYGVVVTGLRPGKTRMNGDDLGKALGTAIFNALSP